MKSLFIACLGKTHGAEWEMFRNQEQCWSIQFVLTEIYLRFYFSKYEIASARSAPKLLEQHPPNPKS